jgi:hypothetical protein
MFTIAIVTIGLGIAVSCCSAGAELYPPGGKRIVNVTESDSVSGNAAYRRLIGRRFRILVPGLAVCEALKVTRGPSPVEVSPRSWLDRFVTVRNIEHLRIHYRAGYSGYFIDYIHCVLERDSGERGHWFDMLSSPDHFPKEIGRSPVLDAFQAIFAPEALPGSAGAIPGSFETIGAGGPSGAPLLETVQGEERAAPERLIALLDRSVSKGIEEAGLYTKQYRFHEVAKAVVLAVGKLPPDEQGVRHTRQTAARVLGRIGDPLAVDPLVRMLQDDNPFVKKAAARALAEIGSWRALPAFEGLLTSLLKPVVEPAPSPGGAVVDIYFFRQHRWETSLDVLAAMVEIATRRGASPAFGEEKSILEAMRTPVPRPDDLLAGAALCYRKSGEPMINGEKIAWLRASVNAMHELIGNYPDDASAPALRRVLFYIGQVRGIGWKGE